MTEDSAYTEMKSSSPNFLRVGDRFTVDYKPGEFECTHVEKDDEGYQIYTYKEVEKER